MLTFDYDLLKYRDFTLDIVGQVVSGGISGGGQQQVVNATGGGLWALKMDGFILRKPAQIRAWRALQVGSQSGVVPINIALCELRNGPESGVPHSDLTPFGDEALYFSPGGDGELVSDAALRATTAVVSFMGQAPRPGVLFSMEYGDDRHELHMVLTSEPTGDNHTITFAPPLRAAHTAGDTVVFGHPMLTVRLADPGSMSLTISSFRFASPSATFIEYLT